MFACLLSACDRPAEPSVPPRPAAREERPETAPSQKQIADRSEQCRQKSSEEFRRAWKDEPAGIAAFTSHYNARMNTCFYQLTLDAAGTLRKMLFDLNEGELYGEFAGPPEGQPRVCRVIAFYCASGGEWEVLVRPYMES